MLKKNKILTEEDINKINKDTTISSKMSGVLLFGLQLKTVKAVRKVLPDKDPNIYPFDELSDTTRRRHVLKIAKQVNENFEQNREDFFHPIDQAHIKQTQLEINGNIYGIHYGKLDEKDGERLKQAVVKSIDCGHISRDAYRSLTYVDQSLPCEKAISITRRK